MFCLCIVFFFHLNIKMPLKNGSCLPNVCCLQFLQSYVNCYWKESYFLLFFVLRVVPWGHLSSVFMETITVLSPAALWALFVFPQNFQSSSTAPWTLGHMCLSQKKFVFWAPADEFCKTSEWRIQVSGSLVAATHIWGWHQSLFVYYLHSVNLERSNIITFLL